MSRARHTGAWHLAGARLAASMASAAWLIVAARELSTPDFADLGLLLALGAILSVVADFGYSLLLNHVVAEAGGLEPGLLRHVLSKRLLGSLIAAVLLVVIFQLLSTSGDLLPALLFAGSLVATSAYTTVSAALRGVGDIGWESANEVISRMLVLVGGSLLLSTAPRLVTAVLIYVAADVISGAVALGSARRLFAGYRVCSEHWREQISLRAALPLAGSGVVGVLYNRVDVAMLAWLASPPAVGWYVAATRIAEAAALPANAEAALVLNRLSSVEPPLRAAVLRRRVALSVALAMLAMASIAILAEPMMSLAFGPGFDRGGTALRVLSLSVPPAAAVAVLAPHVASRHARYFLLSVGGALTLDLFLNLLLVPEFDAVGASWSTVASAGLLAVLLRTRSRMGQPR